MTELQIKELDGIILNDIPIEIIDKPTAYVNQQTGEVNSKDHTEWDNLYHAETWSGDTMQNLCEHFSKSIEESKPSKILFLPISLGAYIGSEEFVGQEGNIIRKHYNGNYTIRAAFVYLNDHPKRRSEEVTSIKNNGGGITVSGHSGNATSTTFMMGWIQPSLIDTIVNDDSIELIYKQNGSISNNFGSIPSRVYKIIYSCKNGMWHVSEPVIGKIIEATEEKYEFPQ